MNRISAENEMFRKKRHRNNLCLRCPVCPATLSSHHHLERHINAHENQMGKFECKFCGKKFEIKHRYQVSFKPNNDSIHPFQFEGTLLKILDILLYSYLLDAHEDSYK